MNFSKCGTPHCSLCRIGECSCHTNFSCGKNSEIVWQNANNLPHYICHTIFATLYLPHYICHTIFATLYLPHYICHTIFATLYLPHYICHTIFATLYLPHYICHTIFATLYLPHYICHTIFATLYLPHYICHTIFATLYCHTILPHSRVWYCGSGRYSVARSTDWKSRTFLYHLYHFLKSGTEWYKSGTKSFNSKLAPRNF